MTEMPIGPQPAAAKMPHYSADVGTVRIPRWPFQRNDSLGIAIELGHQLGDRGGYRSLDDAVAAARNLSGAGRTATSIFEIGDRFRIAEATIDADWKHKPDGGYAIRSLDFDGIRQSQAELGWISTTHPMRALVDGDRVITAVNP